MKFEELAQIALLGTERQPLPMPKGATALEQFQARLDLNRREEALLAAAAMAGLHERVGSLAAPDSGPIPEPSKEEELPRMSERAGSLLSRLLSGDHAELLPEFLSITAAAKQIVFPEALPALLTIGTEKAALRESILPVIGARGIWLAQQNSEWSWINGAASPDENIWLTAEPPARLMFLGRLRKENSVRARELLISTWKEESPEDRAAFVSVLEYNLNLADEPFLESALDDKRKEVRRAAAALLSRLPDSAFVKRMTERAKPLLNFVPAEAGSLLKFKKAKPAALNIILPSECDKTMQRDGVEPKPPQGTGEKVWWLIQMIESVPLGVWTTDWQINPAEIIATASSGEWKKDLIDAFILATVRQKNPVWAAALFAVAMEQKRFEKVEGLLAAMSSEDRETRIGELLAAADGETRQLCGTFLARSHESWSPGFSRAVITWLKRLAGEQSSDWQLGTQLKAFAPRLAPAVLAEALNGWPTNSQWWDFWSKGIDEFLAAAQFRADVHVAFSNQNP